MNEIDKLIAEKRQKRDGLAREIEIVDAEIKALNDAKSAIQSAGAFGASYAAIHAAQLERANNR